jgi:hypothetical protein
MSDDWEAVTKIGSKVRPGGSSVAKEKVIRSEAQLNAARRQGAVIETEKKFGGTNSVSCSVRYYCSPRPLSCFRDPSIGYGDKGSGCGELRKAYRRINIAAC